MSKSKKEKTASKSKILALVVIAFAVAPLLINVGLVITDIIYEWSAIIKVESQNSPNL